MNLDQDLCLCFHVSRRKVVNYLRVERPRRASQLSDCGGAGTGCGWCRPYLRQLFDESRQAGGLKMELPSADDYAQMRQRYRDNGNSREA